MKPEITIHRPRGVLPKLAIQKRTAVDYQPSWLVVAIPTLAALRAMRRRSRKQDYEEQQPQFADDSELPRSRFRRAQVVLVAVPRVRRSRRTSSSDLSTTSHQPVDAAMGDQL